MDASASPPREPRAVEVRALRSGDLDAAVDVLARGFAEEPGNLAPFPDPATRAGVLRTATRLELGWAMPLGSVRVATFDGVGGGVAVWEPPGRSTDSIGGLGRALVHAVPELPGLLRPVPHKASVLLHHSPQAVPLVLARRRAVARASADLAWHLAFLATSPEHRGRGLARRLLDRPSARCDHDSAAVWLPELWVMCREATTDRTVEPAGPDQP